MPDIQNDNYSIVPHTHESRVLLLQTVHGWTLPQHQANAALEINRAMFEQLGLAATVLYCAYDRYQDDEREDTHRVYALENHSPHWPLIESGQWVSQTDLNTLELAVPEHRAILETWFAEMENSLIATQRLPWARIGWLDTVISWLGEHLPSLDYRLAGPIEQISVSIWSCVLRVPTTGENLYFKASAPVFSYEPVLTQTLATLFPAIMPPVLAIERTRHWMLMRDAGKTLASQSEERADIAHWETMLGVYVQMQIDAVAHIDNIEAAGSPDYRLHRLPDIFEEVLNTPSLLLVGQENGLPIEELEQLRASVPQLKEMCEQLASYNVPETLHHDDFHGGNVLLNEHTYIFFDWAECALAHPFYSMVIAQRYAKYVLEYDNDMLTRLCDAYLAPWTRYEPMERLREAFALAQRLGKLCRAFTWYRLLSHLEPSAQWEYASSLPYWLRLFLGTVE